MHQVDYSNYTIYCLRETRFSEHTPVELGSYVCIVSLRIVNLNDICMEAKYSYNNIIYLSDKQHTECRGCSAKQKAYWSLYIVKNVNYEFHKLLVKNDTANN